METNKRPARRTQRASLLAVALGLAVGVGVAPAQAEVRVIGDRAGDGAADIRQVRIQHSERTLSVRITMAPDEFAHFYDLWVDTDPSSPGPERLISVSAETLPRTSVSITDEFGDLFGKQVCRVRSARQDNKRDQLRVWVPRRCLATDGTTPTRVRLAVETSDETGRHDWAPGLRKFSGFVRSGS